MQRRSESEACDSDDLWFESPFKRGQADPDSSSDDEYVGMALLSA